MKRFLVAVLIAFSSPAHAFAFGEDDIEAIGRTAYAEHHDSLVGRIGVIETILNRWKSGEFGSRIQDIINAKWQFEPVTRAGGWRGLPALTDGQRTEINDILFMKESGHLGELTKGATYFQNEEVVKLRAASGQVRPEMVGFNGMPKVAEIGAHTFYSPARKMGIVPVSSSDQTMEIVARHVPVMKIEPNSVGALVFGGEE